MSEASATTPGMLNGIRVIDIAGESLSFAGRVFADLGADVILVEPPAGGPSRHAPPIISTPTGAVSAHFVAMAAGKRSVTLDLQTGPGRSVFCRLLAGADVLLTTEPVGRLESLGLGPEDLREVHPGLVFTSVTPFGRTGPRRRWLGEDLIGWATSGTLPSVGDPDRAPLAPAGGLADRTSALNAAVGTLLALRARHKTGKGQVVDISQQEAVLSVGMEASPLYVLDTGAWQERRGKRRATPPMGHYATKDGAVTMVAFNPWQWDALADWISEETGVIEVTLDLFKGTPADRAPYVDAIDAWVEELTMKYTKQQFFEEAQRRGIPATPVNSAANLFDDPHLRATDAWIDVDGGELGSIHLPVPPLRFDGQRLAVGAVPALGEHNRAVLVDELGLSEEEFAALSPAATAG